MGVRLSETNPEIRMATTMVTENSCSSRPTIPLMNSTGMKTATSEIVIEIIVKPISREADSAACMRDSPISMWRTMFSSITMASSTTKPTRQRERHEREIVQAVAQQVHHREGADDGKRHRGSRESGWPRDCAGTGR